MKALAPASRPERFHVEEGSFLEKRIILLATILAIAACSTEDAPRTGAPPSSTAETLPATASPQPLSPFDTTPPDMQVARRLAGCYDLRLGPWSKPRAHAGNIPTPARVDLMLDLRTPTFSAFPLVAHTSGFADQRERYPGAWSPVGTDSLQARVWGDGMSSVTLFMRRQPNTEFRGVARYFTDARAVDSTGRWMWETYPTATATLRPTNCDPVD